jgi:alcohol dehydrogenase class IV
MLGSYDLLSPQHIVFGWGRRNELGQLIQPIARRVFLVSGSKTLESAGIISGVVDEINRAGVACSQVATISHEPEVADVDQLVADLIKDGAGEGDCLLAVGGGSAIDLAKAASALVTNRESSTVQDYLEGVGAGLQISQAPIPLVAVPTTAGTGTEATKNAVISCYDPPFKKSLRSNQMVPKIVVVDPELTAGLPSATTAYTGMDAITQLIESYVSCRAKPIPQALSVQGLGLAISSIAFAVESGQDVGHPATKISRTNMAHAALLSGMALANSGLGMAHGVAAALGVHAKVPHGLACAMMLPVSIKANCLETEVYAVLGQEVRRSVCAQEDSVLSDPALLAVVNDAWNQESNNQDDLRHTCVLFSVIEHLCNRLNIPKSLSETGVKRDQIPAIVRSSRGNSMSGNPREISDDDLATILESMLG